MDNQSKHLYVDAFCACIMLFGLILLIFKNIPFIFPLAFLLLGIIGMELNEWINPFNNQNMKGGKK